MRRRYGKSRFARALAGARQLSDIFTAYDPLTPKLRLRLTPGNANCTTLFAIFTPIVDPVSACRGHIAAHQPTKQGAGFSRVPSQALKSGASMISGNRRIPGLRNFALALALFFQALLTTPAVAADPNTGPGGPILVVTSSGSTFSKFYAEILRAEGLNSFAVIDVGSVSSSTLNNYDVVILANATLTSTQLSAFTTWVNNGGNLIAMDPNSQLASLLGVNISTSQISNGYLAVNKSTPVGAGIAGASMQYHGAAKLITLNGASSLATLYSSATASTGAAAITLNSVGSSGGQAASFAFDLAKSVVYTRQGNPAWASQERDGLSPVRSNDKFFGASASDPQANWVDLNKVAIPQADEQQRLLANLITVMERDRKPLPRFWYLPNGHRAAVVMTGDDHNNNGTTGRFNQLIAASPAGCNVANWECLRGTSYVFPLTQIS